MSRTEVRKAALHMQKHRFALIMPQEAAAIETLIQFALEQTADKKPVDDRDNDAEAYGGA